MKKTLLILCLLIFSIGRSQDFPITDIQSYLNVNKSKLGLSTSDITDWVVDGTGSSESTKIDNYYIKQRYQGIEVHNTVSNVWYKDRKVINFQNLFVSNISSKVNTTIPSINALEALNNAISQLNAVPFTSHVIESKSSTEFVLSNGILEEDHVKAELVFQPLNDNLELRLAWDLTFYTQDYKHLWSVRIDALTGNVLEKHDWVLTCNFGDANHANHNHSQNFFFTKKGFKEELSSMAMFMSGSYRVFPFEIESPNHGTRQLISNPHDVVASPYGWHDTNGATGAEYTITRGNNVWAQEDANGNNGTGASPNGGAGLMFDYPYGGVGVNPTTYTDAATTNLFYMNNIMHDVWYKYGFNEANGNFQQNNYGRGTQPGVTGDAVFADSQDGSGVNNANFSTPADGTRPRMQMFLWNVGPRPEYLTVNSPSIIAGGYVAANNVFDPGNVPLPPDPGLTQDLVLYNDGGVSEACVPALNASELNGKIAIIRRGNCPFVEKVKNAQNAGAIAVIIVNNDVDNPNLLVNMSGEDGTITIPAIFVSYNVGEALITAMGTNVVNATIKDQPITFVNSDGDFDNLVIAHEYGHGISTRLTGGPSTSCMNNAEQMGEGWSDWFGLMLQMKAGDDRTAPRGIATFLVSEPTNGTGIRSYPYSTDFSVNPFTFASSNSEAVPHGVGSVWATMLWDLAWAYVDKYGFDPDKYNGTGGNNKVMRLVIDGLKLQGCSPTFVSARNALIAADQATTGGQDYCMIWEVFARRGLGVNASSGSATNATDQVQDFTEPAAGPNCTLSANYFNNNDIIKVYPNPTKGLLNISILSNYDGDVKIQLFDLNGRKVYNENSSSLSNVKTLNIGQLQKGIYLLKIDGTNLSYTTKVILN